MTGNIFDNIPTNTPEELFVSLLKTSNIRIEKIVSYGKSSPDGFWYDQEEHEWIILLKGAARLTVDDRTIELRQGDYLNIPSHTKHRVEWTTPDEPTVWLAVFYGG
jgi:cupin 2 domain-containing protein